MFKIIYMEIVYTLTILDSILKAEIHDLLTMVHLVKVMVFQKSWPDVRVGRKEGLEHLKN